MRISENARVGNRADNVRESNAAAVLATIRSRGALSRAAIARATALSMPTVSRQVAALIERELLRELPDRSPNGAVGRPRVPVDINNEVVAACGVHIGVRTTTYGLADLRGGVLDSQTFETPGGGAEDALAQIAGRARAFLRRWPRRKIIGIGVASGGATDPTRGTLAHEGLGWREVPAQTLLERATGLPVRLDGHVPAMASAELLFGSSTGSGSMLYFYARQMVGAAFAVHGRLHRGPGRASTIAHLPVGGDVRCSCGSTGCLEANVAELAVLRKAIRAGVLTEPSIRLLREAARDGDQEAVRILSERARTLGRAVALLRDAIDPDVVVLGGQAITDAPDYLPELLDSFAAHTALPGTDLVRVTGFGPDVQAIAACTGLLTQLYEFPLSVVPRVFESN
ncbi:putative NBD/HSP70 family sugar kinase [Tamaricihabitans halophyticus]|uniref:Putative NBD/HSP70 family sugar kinase n=1 Tax=Tamaricihabitans halophyticus TaxID=1262583 RepID=A0A4R2QIF8_9PSEU|nr:ROK family transcriptional regulator [Tamaricihabitans halophyticus]TCP48454.1 putative NBD/HSP70 family sugar kinase [Tamaricihabitans halophyticus]